MSETYALIGPIRADTQDQYEQNVKAFDVAAAALREMGHRALNPADLDRDNGVEWPDLEPSIKNVRRVIGIDLLRLVHEATAVYLLPGWQSSRLGRVELALAVELGLKVHTCLCQVEGQEGDE